MYEVPRYYITNGNNVNQETRRLMDNIRQGIDVERSKNDLFKLTYPMALTALKRYTNLNSIEEMIGDLSVAFMKTVKYYNPEASTVSFMNYYKRAIHSEVIQSRYGVHRYNKELVHYYEGTMEYLDRPIKNKELIEDGIYSDLIEDDYWDRYFDDYVNDEGFIDDLRRAVNNALYKKKKGVAIRDSKSKVKQAFEIYIDNLINDKHVTQTEIGIQLGMGKSNVNNAIAKYMSRLKDELKNMGY